MRFEEVLPKIKEGIKVRRAVWPRDSRLYWDKSHGSCFYFIGVGSRQEIYIINTSWLLAEDWEVYEK
jgi:hypothetical protein